MNPAMSAMYYASPATPLLMPAQPEVRAHPLLNAERFFQLSVDNPLKHCRLEQFSNEVKQKFFEIELKHDNLENLQNCIRAQMKNMEQDLEQLRTHSSECARLAGNVSSKQQRTKGLIEGIIADNHDNLVLYEEAQKQWQLLKASSSAALDIPSTFFINLEQDFAKRVEKYKARIAEIEELVNIQMQAKEAEVEATPELLFEILQNMNDSLLLIAGTVCEVRETLGAIKLRFIQLAKERTGRSEADLAGMFKMPPTEFAEAPVIPPLGSMREGRYASGGGLMEKPVTEQDKFYQGLLAGPSSMMGTRKYI